MSKLQELVNKTKCSIDLSINMHKDYYQTVKECIDELGEEEQGEMTDYNIEKMIKHDTIIRLQLYPHTPIGSYTLYGWDLDILLDQALRTFDNE